MEGGGVCGGTGSSHTHQIGFPPRKRLRTTHNLARTHTDDRLHTRASANLHMHKVDGLRADVRSHVRTHLCQAGAGCGGEGRGMGL